MTPKKIAEWIVERHGGCGLISCSGSSYGYHVNHGTPCPLHGCKFDCKRYGSPLQAAQAWLEANGEDV